MKDSINFRFDRLLKLLRNEVKLNHRGVFIVAGAVFLFLLFLSAAVSERVGYDGDFFGIWYGITLLGGGFLYTSIICRELNRSATTHLYLTTPASTLEKFIAKWLLTTVGYVLVHGVLYSIFTAAALGIDAMDGHTYFTSFSVFGRSAWLLIKIYLAVQSVFLVGSIYFRKYEIFKTVLSVSLVGWVLFFITALMFRIVFNEYFDGWSFATHTDHIRLEPNNRLKDLAENRALPVLQYLFWVGLPLLMWTVGFFKLKETEA